MNINPQTRLNQLQQAINKRYLAAQNAVPSVGQADASIAQALREAGANVSNFGANRTNARIKAATDELIGEQDKQRLAEAIVARQSRNPVRMITNPDAFSADAKAVLSQVQPGDRTAIQAALGGMPNTRADIAGAVGDALTFMGGSPDQRTASFRQAQVARAGVAGVAGGSALTAAGSGLLDLMAYVESTEQQIVDRANTLV